MVDKMALGQTSSVSNIPPLFHIHSYIIWGMAVSPSAAQFNEDVASLTRQKQQRSSVQVGSRYIQKEIQVLYRYC
jgi:hypothetical protein